MEMQNKGTVRDHCIHIRMTKMRRLIISSVDKDIKQLEYSYSAVLLKINIIMLASGQYLLKVND